MSATKKRATTRLLNQIRSCAICKASLPYVPKPICSFTYDSKVLLVGQAPGIKVHKSGVPWDDASGERLRDWLGVSSEEFYDTGNFAIVPMGFCYPGKAKSGDAPPRPECSAEWMEKVLSVLESKKQTLLIGQYAQDYFLGEKRERTLTLTVKNWKTYKPNYIVLPHPSPRNNIWLKKNPWFEKEVLPYLRRRIKSCLGGSK